MDTNDKTSQCIESLRLLSSPLIAIANSASSDISFLAINTDPSGFAVDIGNFDLCQRQMPNLHHCLAGSVLRGDRYAVLAPHAGICVPSTCDPSALENGDVSRYIYEEIVKLIGNSVADGPAASMFLTPIGQQRFIYFSKLRNVVSLIEQSGTGYTCGDNKASMTFDRYLFFAVFVILTFVVICCTLYHMVATGYNLETLKTPDIFDTASDSASAPSSSASPQKNYSLVKDEQTQNKEEKYSSKFSIKFTSYKKIVEAFSLLHNIPLIFHQQSTKSLSTFAILDGFRAISILWIVLGHTLALSSSIGLMNPATVLPPDGFLKATIAQIYFSSRFAVDTFFYISGFLVILSLLRRLDPILDDESLRGDLRLAANTAPPPVIISLSLLKQALNPPLPPPRPPLSSSSSSSSSSAHLNKNNPLSKSSSPSPFIKRPKKTQCAACKSKQHSFFAASQKKDIIQCADCTAKDLAIATRLSAEANVNTHTVLDDDGDNFSNSYGSMSSSSPPSSPIDKLTSSSLPSAAPVVVTPPLILWLPAFYLHRIVRILPPYLFCLLLWWKIGVLLGSGPFWYRWLSYTNQCDKYWWTNVFFINNLYPSNIPEVSECFYVSWYLGVDMQFYIVSPVFAWLFLRSNLYGLASVAIVCGISIVAAVISTILYDLSAHSFDGLWVTDYSIVFYTKPLFRIAPYCIGMMTAMLWHVKCRHFNSVQLSNATARTLLVSAISIVLVLVFGFASAYQNRPCQYLEKSSEICGSHWTLTSRVLYNSFSKVLWALALAIMTLLSGINQGGFVQTFLSHRVFAPIARTSFSIYLLHVFIINLWVLSATQKKRYSHLDLVMTFTAITCLSAVAAVLLTVMIETPSAKLGKIVEAYISGRIANSGIYKAVPLTHHISNDFDNNNNNNILNEVRDMVERQNISEVGGVGGERGDDSFEPLPLRGTKRPSTPSELSRLL